MPSPEITEDVLDLPSPVMPASSKQKDSLIDYGMVNKIYRMQKNKIKKNSCNLPFYMQLVLIVDWFTKV